MSGFCNQRKLLMTYITPTSRAEIEPPPPGYSTSQLDMRRKSEILQYKNNQTNNQNSKKSEYAKRVRGTYNRKKICNNNIASTTSSTYTDVPGSSILIHDPNVPLYKYNTNYINRYSSTDGIIQEKEIQEWAFFPFADLIITKNIDGGVLSIYDDIKFDSYTYTFTTPVMTQIIGKNVPVEYAGCECKNRMIYISLDVYYNENIVFSSAKDITSSIKDNLFTIDHPVGVTNGVFDIEYIFYNGIITFDNIVLPTSTGFNYEFKFDTFNILDVDTNNSNGGKDSNIIKNIITTNTIVNIQNTKLLSNNITPITENSTDNSIINITAI
tara:strand:- start:413 stop:1390 length:978 start_codon:yes stop_codon:yes gene_type:complete